MITATSLTPQTPAPTSTTATSSTTGSGSSTSASTSTTGPQAGSQDYFLKLLVAQMQNQDPLNPMDNAQVTTQMAAINTVQGIQGLETTLTSLLSTFNATQSVQATNLVGQNVLAPGSALNLSGGSASGGVSLAAKADNVVVSVLNSSQQVVQSMNLGAESAGTLSFNWDGTSNSGAKLPDGAYTFSVSASAAGQPVTATTLANGKVTGVDPSSSGANVSVGSLGTFSLSQISQIQ